MQEKDVTEIVRKYKTGTATEEEIAFLESWYLHHQEPEEFKYDLKERLQDADEVWSNLEKQTQKPKRFTLWPAVAAAMVIIILGIGYFFRQDIIPDKAQQTVQQDIAPGGNKAVLTLANGKKVSLTDAKKGEIADESGVELEKAADGEIIYKITGHEKSSETPEFNTIETPKGGQFQINLPDGSKVWLNSTSSLKYPVYFDGATERKVELRGEAYFEVAKDKTKPFIVKTSNQQVKVLGTHFNINAYTDETSVKTTLLEGSVQVSTSSSLSNPSSLSTSSLRGGTTKQPHTGKEVASSLRFPRNDDGRNNNGRNDEVESDNGVLLKPGQQAVLANKHFNIISVDTQDAIAWKKGNFEFDNADIQTVMRQLSRWYDIKVVYEGEIPKIHYSGTLPKNNNISVVLNMLKKTGKLNFKIEKKTVTVSK